MPQYRRQLPEVLGGKMRNSNFLSVSSEQKEKEEKKKKRRKKEKSPPATVG